VNLNLKDEPDIPIVFAGLTQHGHTGISVHNSDLCSQFVESMRLVEDLFISLIPACAPLSLGKGMPSLERVLLFVMLTVILASLFVPALDSAITESGKNENLQNSKTELKAHSALSGAPLGLLESATTPIVQWNATYGGTGQDDAFAFVQTSDGGYALAGRTLGDVYLVKTDAGGKMQWEKTYGGQYGDEGFSIVQTSDGGFAVAGRSHSFNPYGRSDMYLVKTDKMGNFQWNKTYGELWTYEGASSMVQTGDEGFVLAGHSYPGIGDQDIYLVKTDSNGGMQWNKTYAGTGADTYQVHSVVQTGDGGYAVAGSCYDHSTEDTLAFLIKTDSVGEITWSQSYGARNCQAFSMVQTGDGGYALAGMNFTYGAASNYGDAWLVKTDSLGNMTWSRNYGSSSHYSHEFAQSLVQTTDGGYTLAGRKRYNYEDYNLYLVRTDAYGYMQWNITYGGTDEDFAMALVQTADGGYATAGCTESFGTGGDDFWLVKFSAPDDLYVASVEPIQVVLDAKALVANKSTAIRATISSTFESRVLVEINVTYDSGRKWYLEDGPNDLGIPLDPGLNRVYIPGGPVKPTARPWPWDWQDQLLWTSIGFDSSIRALVDPLDKIVESDETNNERTTSMKVVGSRNLRILVVPVYFRDQDRPNYESLKSKSDSARNYLLDMFPIANNTLDWELAPPRKMPWYVSVDPLLVEDIYWFVARPLAKEARGLGYDRVVVVIKPTVPTVPSAYSYTYLYGDRTPVVVRADTGWDMLAAHEIGHTYYLGHPQDLGPPVYTTESFDIAKRSYEESVNVFMDPDLGQWGWIDKQRYDSDPRTCLFVGLKFVERWNLFDQLTFNPHESSQEVIALSGVVFRNNTVQSEPWYCIAEGKPDLLPGTEGNYSIVLLDQSRQIVARMGFNASFTGLLDINGTLVDHEVNFITFDLNIPCVTNAAYVEVRDSTEHVLVERRVTDNSPIINVTNPNGGEVLTGGINCTVSWEASDVDEDELAYLLACSHDGGETWIPMALDVTEKTFVWDTSGLPSGNNYLVKVIATDGVNVGEDVSNGTFTVKVHDIACTGISESKKVVGEGYAMNLDATVMNLGNFPEIVSVTAYANETAFQAVSVALEIGASSNTTLTWNTTGFVKGNYSISIRADPVSYEFNIEDNNFTGTWATVSLAGDVTGPNGFPDGKVDVRDVYKVARNYGTVEPPGLPPWDSVWGPICDINNDCRIDVKDYYIVCKHYGEVDP
jgi:hypothetical protein